MPKLVQLTSSLRTTFGFSAVIFLFTMSVNAHGAAVSKKHSAAKTSKARVIKIEMNDQLRFVPANITVKQGETVKLVVKNIGSTRHEIAIGTDEELKEHAEMMRKMPNMKHADNDQLTLEPGKSGTLTQHFKDKGVLHFACFEPGHSEAGMTGQITVE